MAQYLIRFCYVAFFFSGGKKKGDVTYWIFFSLDLGPISLNWFEELSLEAPPYESKMLEEPEYQTGWLDQSTFKTPKGKLSLYSQLASTPLIFKEHSTTLRLLSSPVQDLGQKRIGAGEFVLK